MLTLTRHNPLVAVEHHNKQSRKTKEILTNIPWRQILKKKEISEKVTETIRNSDREKMEGAGYANGLPRVK